MPFALGTFATFQIGIKYRVAVRPVMNNHSPLFLELEMPLRRYNLLVKDRVLFERPLYYKQEFDE